MTEKGRKMKDLVNHMVQALVDDIDKIDVKEITTGTTTVIELRVAKEDVGKVIGKQGRTAQAIRTILGAVSSKKRTRTVLEILDSARNVLHSWHLQNSAQRIPFDSRRCGLWRILKTERPVSVWTKHVRHAPWDHVFAPYIWLKICSTSTRCTKGRK